MFKKSILEKKNIMFDDKYHIIGDFDFTLKFFQSTNFSHVKQHLTFRFWHGENESIKNREIAVIEIENWINDNHEFYPNYQNEINFLKNKIFYDKLNFKLKKKNMSRQSIFF